MSVDEINSNSWQGVFLQALFDGDNSAFETLDERTEAEIKKCHEDQAILAELRKELILYSDKVFTYIKDELVAEIVYGESNPSREFNKNLEIISAKSIIKKAEEGFNSCGIQADMILKIEQAAKTVFDTAIDAISVHRSQKSELIDKRNSFKDLAKAFEVLNYRISPIFDFMLAEVKRREQRVKELILQNTERKHKEYANKKLRDAYTDAVSGIISRKGFEEGMSTTKLSELKNTGVLIVDIDLFKRVNDTYGHPVGDKVIKMVGQTIHSVLRGKDRDPIGHVARWGGEEFVALVGLGDKTPDNDLSIIAERIRAAVKSLNIPELKGNTITISLGGAKIDIDSGEKPMDVVEYAIQTADRGLYAAKQSGRNKYVSGHEIQNEKQQPTERASVWERGA